MGEQNHDSEPPPATLLELFDRMYPLALDCGIRYDEFWDMTLKEITQVMQSYTRKEERLAKQNLAMNYNLAGLVSDFVARKLNGKKIPSLYETFPALADPKVIMEQKQDEQKEYNEAMRYKIQFMQMASAHNKKRKSKGGAS